MTPDEIRIAVAEACGWQCVHAETFSDGNGGFTYDVRGMPPKHNLRREIPDYCNDLNACHAAENLLLSESLKQGLYTEMLCELAGVYEGDDTPLHLRAVCFAPAARRAEAIVKTLGLWKDAP